MDFESTLVKIKARNLEQVRLKGECVDSPEITGQFYSPSRPARVHAIKKYCVPCTVKKQCYTISVINREVFGIWGGLDELTRYNIESAVRVKLNKTKKNVKDCYDIRSKLDPEYYQAIQAFADQVAVQVYELPSLKRDKTKRKPRLNPLVNSS